VRGRFLFVRGAVHRRTSAQDAGHGPEAPYPGRSARAPSGASAPACVPHPAPGRQQGRRHGRRTRDRRQVPLPRCSTGSTARRRRSIRPTSESPPRRSRGSMTIPSASWRAALRRLSIRPRAGSDRDDSRERARRLARLAEWLSGEGPRLVAVASGAG
jgi:hypothetical protein